MPPGSPIHSTTRTPSRTTEEPRLEVHVALDATQQQTLKALDEFAAALPGAEAALLYYSGHGLQLEGAKLLPIDIGVSRASVRSAMARSSIAEVVAT